MDWVSFYPSGSCTDLNTGKGFAHGARNAIPVQRIGKRHADLCNEKAESD